jgi:receptor protein-tyrosine kinase
VVQAAESEPVPAKARPSPAGRAWDWEALSWLAPKVPLRQVICVLGAGQDAVAEQFRLLHTRLQRLQERRRLRSIVITSALPQEGKSFVALNLAAVMSQYSSERVLLLEADLRRPSYCAALGLDLAAGLGEYCRSNQGLARFVYRIRGANFCLLPAGQETSSPMEVLASAAMGDILEETGRVFNWVLVDSPALVPAADSALLSHLCDGVLLVVRRNRTSNAALREARERIEQEKLLGVALNDFPVFRGKGYLRQSEAANCKEPISIPDYPEAA